MNFSKPVSIIAAMTKSHVIGIDNSLPWHIPDDLKLFKEMTIGNIVVMGRKTFESIGKPLPKRKNFVVSASISSNGKETGIVPAGNYEESKLYYFPTLENALCAACDTAGNIFVIGGASVYNKAIEFADKMYISFVKKDYKGNIYFPDFKTDEWNILEEREYNDFIFTVFKKRTKISVS